MVRPLTAEALVVAPAVRATAAAESAFEDDAVAFFDFVDVRGVPAELFDPAENLVAEDDRIIHLELAVKVFDIRAADAAHLDLDEAAVRRNVR